MRRWLSENIIRVDKAPKLVHLLSTLYNRPTAKTLTNAQRDIINKATKIKVIKYKFGGTQTNYKYIIVKFLNQNDGK